MDSEDNSTCEKNILMNRNHIKLNLQGSAKFRDPDSDSKQKRSTDSYVVMERFQSLDP